MKANRRHIVFDRLSYRQLGPTHRCDQCGNMAAHLFPIERKVQRFTGDGPNLTDQFICRMRREKENGSLDVLCASCFFRRVFGPPNSQRVLQRGEKQPRLFDLVCRVHQWLPDTISSSISKGLINKDGEYSAHVRKVVLDRYFGGVEPLVTMLKERQRWHGALIHEAVSQDLFRLLTGLSTFREFAMCALCGCSAPEYVWDHIASPWHSNRTGSATPLFQAELVAAKKMGNLRLICKRCDLLRSIRQRCAIAIIRGWLVGKFYFERIGNEAVSNARI